MPMFNLNSEAPEETLIRFTAGEDGEVGMVVRGDENVSVDLVKSESVTFWWRPDRADDVDAWEADHVE